MLTMFSPYYFEEIHGLRHRVREETDARGSLGVSRASGENEPGLPNARRGVVRCVETPGRATPPAVRSSEGMLLCTQIIITGERRQTC